MIPLTATIYGDAGVGKSWLLATTPAPRLILDAEGGSRFTPGRKVVWDPARQDPPVVDGTWDTCLVYVLDYPVLDRVYQWLLSGQHPFRSLSVDHLTEVQKRIVAHFNGTTALREADWGTLLRHSDDWLRRHRDLCFLPDAKIETFVCAAAMETRDGKVMPLMQGSFRNVVPYATDLLGYLYTDQAPETGALRRRLLINPVPPYAAKDRTDILTRVYGSVIDNPNISDMLAVLNSTTTQGDNA